MRPSGWLEKVGGLDEHAERKFPTLESLRRSSKMLTLCWQIVRFNYIIKLNLSFPRIDARADVASSQ